MIIELLNSLDTQVFLALNGMHAPFFDRFMMLFSGKWIWVPMYCALLMIMLRMLSPRQVLLYLCAIALTITLADQTCATLIRPVVERLRPSNPDNPLSALVHIVNGYRGGAYGFPSCHAANSFALATFASLLLRHRKFSVWILTWAVINSYSRIYLGVHYPGDLIVGGCIGAVWGAAIYVLATRTDSMLGLRNRTAEHARLRQRIFPSLSERLRLSSTMSLPTRFICVSDLMTGAGISTVLVIAMMAIFA